MPLGEAFRGRVDGPDSQGLGTRAADPIPRRRILFALLGLTSLGFGQRSSDRAVRDLCRATPSQTKGPSYPPTAQLEAQLDKDLTQVGGRSGHAPERPGEDYEPEARIARFNLTLLL